MKNFTSNLMITAGMLMMLSAVGLAGYNIREDRDGGAAAGEILARLKPQIAVTAEAAPAPPPEDDPFFAPAPEQIAEELEIDIDENKYIGILSVPSLGLELPVMNGWNYQRLKLAPCRYYGTAAEGNLIIAAHNYRTHFGTINQLNSGDTIVFTEANGTVHTYELLSTEILDGYDVEGMMTGAGEDWNLTLYTCTIGGQSRVTVRAIEMTE